MTELTTPFKSVYVTTVAAAAIGALYGLLGIRPSTLPIVFIVAGPLVSVVFWVQNDARRHQLGAIQDFGLFVYLLWPVLVPWYVIKTRGKQAWTLALLLVGAVVAPLALTLLAALWHDALRAVAR